MIRHHKMISRRGMKLKLKELDLLISSGLPDAVKSYETFYVLQNRLPAAALESKTPTKAKHNKKPTGRIQEFEQ